LSSVRVGIVGAGQLGRMLALAGYPLGIRCLFLDRSADTPAAQVAPSLVGDLEDPARLAELASRSDVVTFDWENISGKALEPIEKITKVRPPRAALEVSQDRLAEKALFAKLKIPTTAHAAVDSKRDLVQATQKIGIPGVLKTRRLGYDGKGQFVLRKAADTRSSKLSRVKFLWLARARRLEIRCSIRCPPIRTAVVFCDTARHPLQTRRWNAARGAISSVS